MNNEKLEVGACSETGYVRKVNQDRMSGSVIPLGQLYVVADGMGGHRGGDLAAKMTVRGLQHHISQAPANAPAKAVLQEAFKNVNETVYRRAHSKDPATKGMGSTAVLLLISDKIARIAHVGDSRAYLYRRGWLRQLTKDHSVVQKMIDENILTPEEAADHPRASELERAVGNKPDIEVDISDKLFLNEGDAILLCSDGLSGYVSHSEIDSILRSQATVQEVPRRLVDLALKKGGEDNVTVQFIQYGIRKEALPAEPIPQEQISRVNATPQRHPLIQKGFVFILLAAISAVGFIGYSNLQLRRENDKLGNDLDLLQQELEVAENEKDRAEQYLNALASQLNISDQDQESALS